MKITKNTDFSPSKIDICSVLAALIISMHSIRYIFNIYESNLIIYGIYVLFIAAGLAGIWKTDNILFRKNTGIFIAICIIFLSYVLFSSLSHGLTAMGEAVKFIFECISAFIFYTMTITQYKKTLKMFAFIMVVYIVLLIVFPNNIKAYLSHGSNYLNQTLPIGLFLTMLLSSIIYRLYSKKYDKRMIIEIILIIVSFYSLTQFSGRGSVIFPFITAVVFVLVLGKKHFIKLIIIIILLLLFMIIAYQLYIKYANSYSIERMLQLSNDIESETRWPIWQQYIDYMLNNDWLILGGGAGASVIALGFYPHNIYLQCIGEFGIPGLVMSAYVTFLLIRSQVRVFKKPSYGNDLYIFVMISSMTLYLFLNFMKSFSLFDTTILVMFVAATISISNRIYKSKDYVLEV